MDVHVHPQNQVKRSARSVAFNFNFNFNVNSPKHPAKGQESETSS